PGEQPLVYEVFVEPENIAPTLGLHAQYVAANGEKVERREADLDLDWRTAPPLVPPFDAHWSGIIKLEAYGPHSLRLNVPGLATMKIDGVAVGGSSNAIDVTSVMYKGEHQIDIDAHIDEPGTVTLSDGKSPIPASEYVGYDATFPHGLVATFFH